MYSETFVKVENVSKCYQIYERPHDRLKQFFLPKLLNLLRVRKENYYKEFWALNDINFELKKGETVGIIGRNGSGKSTLLQIVCGILNPTAGKVSVNKRIAALLELGSGFNPEFTGRENVYLNATILGLNSKEIDERYQSIVTFADIGNFIDQPVKKYSSGMLVRLAFAVITHVDAEILIIDEALAVGDAVFTQKCMRWLREFQLHGTILFVSHDSGSVLSLCDRAIWLDKGKIKSQGVAKEVVQDYIEFNFEELNTGSIKHKRIDSKKPKTDSKKMHPVLAYKAEVEITNLMGDSSGWNTGKAEIISIELENASSKENKILHGGELVRLNIKAKAMIELDKPILGFLFRDRLGQDLFGENTLEITKKSPVVVKQGEYIEAQFEFTLPMLPNGTYAVMASIANGTLEKNVQHHWMNEALIVQVSSSKVRWGLVGVPFTKILLEKIIQ